MVVKPKSQFEVLLGQIGILFLAGLLVAASLALTALLILFAATQFHQGVTFVQAFSVAVLIELLAAKFGGKK